MGMRLAHSLISPNILDYIELDNEYSIAEIEATERMIGKTLRQLDVRAKYGCNVMAIRRGNEMNIAPYADDAIKAGDILVVIGHNDDLQNFEEKA